MKKILFATTALVATASVAAADVTLSGMGRFGVLYTGKDGATAASTKVTSRLDINADVSAETESGVTFGSRLRIRANGGAVAGMNGARFYAKSGGFEVAVGNISGGMDSMPGAYGQSAPGLTGLSYAGLVTTSSHSYSGAGAGAGSAQEAAEVKYSFGDFKTHVSHNGTDTEGFAAYTMNGWTVAVAASNTKVAANTKSAMTVSGALGGVSVGLANAKTYGNKSQTTISASTSVGAATTVNAYYNTNDANASTDKKSYGIGLVHDLGGATLKTGIEKTKKVTSADFGVVFNF